MYFYGRTWLKNVRKGIGYFTIIRKNSDTTYFFTIIHTDVILDLY